VVCDGASDDPPQIDLFSRSADEGQVTEAIRGLEALAGAHPASATARVRLGQLALRTQPPSVEGARAWFERALALHGEGCTLAPREHWLALEGSALSHMMSGDYAGALPFLRASVERWPGASGTRYNLACALCQTGDLDGCASELHRAVSSTDELPEILQEQRRSPDQYREMARADPDLAPLRADAGRFAEAMR
jgi:predicted Zn-dependent protease